MVTKSKVIVQKIPLSDFTDEKVVDLNVPTKNISGHTYTVISSSTVVHNDKLIVTTIVSS